MATVKFNLDKRSQKKDGSFPLKLYVTHNSTFRVSTEFSAQENNWEGTQYSDKEPNYKVKNVLIRRLLSKVEKLFIDLEESNEIQRLSDKALKGIIEVKINNRYTPDSRPFVDYLKEFIEAKDNSGTRRVYTTTLNKIRAYDSACTFESMDLTWLRTFEKHMRDAGMKTNALAINMRNVRAVFNYAIDNEITTRYPFRKYKIKSEPTAKRSLTVEQVVLLRDYPCETYQTRYRDIFMLMLYLIGINAVDLFNLKQLVNGRAEYIRAKTGKPYSIKVEPEAMEIIERYKGENWLLNILDEYGKYQDFLHRMGIGLKQIGPVDRKGLGGKKYIEPLFPGISSYWARHTWATLAAELDIPKETISAALGHEIGSEVTSIYIKFDRKKIDEANRQVLDYIKRD